MKKYILNFLFIIFFSSSIFGQLPENNIKGLKFSKALFISLESNKMRESIAFDTTLVIKKNKVWNITSVKAFMVNKDHNPYENETSLWINDQIIHYFKSPFNTPIWLGEGSYRIRMMSRLGNKNLLFISYLSGVEYTIVKD